MKTITARSLLLCACLLFFRCISPPAEGIIQEESQEDIGSTSPDDDSASRVDVASQDVQDAGESNGCPRVLAHIALSVEPDEEWAVNGAYALPDGDLFVAGYKRFTWSTESTAWFGVMDLNGQWRWQQHLEDPLIDPDTIRWIQPRLLEINGQEALMLVGDSPPYRIWGQPRVLWVSTRTGEILSRFSHDGVGHLIAFLPTPALERLGEVSYTIWYGFDQSAPNPALVSTALQCWPLSPSQNPTQPAWSVPLSDNFMRYFLVDQGAYGAAFFVSEAQDLAVSEEPINSYWVLISDEGAQSERREVRVSDHTITVIADAISYNEGSILVIYSATPSQGARFDALSLDAQGRERWRQPLGVYEDRPLSFYQSANAALLGDPVDTLAIVLANPDPQSPTTLWRLSPVTGQPVAQSPLALPLPLVYSTVSQPMEGGRLLLGTTNAEPSTLYDIDASGHLHGPWSLWRALAEEYPFRNVDLYFKLQTWPGSKRAAIASNLYEHSGHVWMLDMTCLDER